MYLAEVLNEFVRSGLLRNVPPRGHLKFCAGARNLSDCRCVSLTLIYLSASLSRSWKAVRSSRSDNSITLRDILVDDSDGQEPKRRSLGAPHGPGGGTD